MHVFFELKSRINFLLKGIRPQCNITQKFFADFLKPKSYVLKAFCEGLSQKAENQKRNINKLASDEFLPKFVIKTKST